MTRYIGRSLLGLCGLALILTAVASPATAALGIEDVVTVQPAATLLLPFFVVDLTPPPPTGDRSNEALNAETCVRCGRSEPAPGDTGAATRQTTILHIGNASATAVLAHVTIWSDLSVPVLSFDIYLTGFDVQHIDLREVLNGVLPRTASAGQDPSDTISPHGLVSQDINFATCNGILPPANLPASVVDHLRNALTGKASAQLSGMCAGRDFGDNVARGYVTIDTVNACNSLTPADVAYTSVITFQNVLYGDWAIIGLETGGVTGGPLVHIAADPPAFVPGDYTFYGRYTSWSAADSRQPLATNFVARYTSRPPFEGGTRLIVWRDSKVKQTPFACGTLPGWVPLAQESIVAFDEQENPAFPTGNPFPAEAQAVSVGGPELPVSFLSGWLFLNLNMVVTGQTPGLTDSAAAQAWVISVHQLSALPLNGPAIDAKQLDNASKAKHNALPVPEL